LSEISSPQLVLSEAFEAMASPMAEVDGIAVGEAALFLRSI
jgi:hypothetical protein